MSAECARLAVDLERLLPNGDADDLDEERKIAFAEAALSKIAALEAAADGDATVLAQVATYEEAMLGVIDGLRPPEEEEPAEAPRAEERRAVPAAQSDSESDPEEEEEPAPVQEEKKAPEPEPAPAPEAATAAGAGPIQNPLDDDVSAPSPLPRPPPRPPLT